MKARSGIRFGLLAATITFLGVACGGRSTVDFGLPTGAGGTAGIAAMGGMGGTSTTGGDGGLGGTTDGGSGNVGGDGGIGGVGGSVGGCDSLATECDVCTCKSCSDPLDACMADTGCAAILDCADTTGCSGIQCYLGPCQQVIDQNGGVLGESTSLAQAVAACRNQNQCPCGGGSGGAGGGGGTGGFGGFGGAPSGGGGSGGTGPLACLSCINQQCPAVQQCIFNQACRDGVICAVQGCMSGGGTPDLGCMLQCFNGDFTAALSAFQALQCFFTQCGQTCGNIIPGLPGGGGLPGFGGAGG